ncbi:pentapeptide repeat-containing protein [Streptomyces sp. WMMC500]|uniref:pentapeptide repeat-containing protein n=1 Tax=Streptomyces sp. WMMC500 TaxID=3015154 RepID=UPI00248BDB5C|nr:pentapeptide repeat-containing protein [Streptomyces sp. WMMC500]WBB64337.1 pentapeptide repeat-containing protein [Streptomyces sp. WMMC500]
MLRRIELVTVLVTAVVAVAGLWYSNVQVNQVRQELSLSEEGQITDRYTAAIANLGEDAIDVRLGGLYALQRIMEDSPRDHPTLVNVLSAYVRTHADEPLAEDEDVPTDVHAALTILTTRDSAHDGTARVDLTGAHLPRAVLDGANAAHGARLAHAKLGGADLTDAVLAGADLRGASLNEANLEGAFLGELSGRGRDEPEEDRSGTSPVTANLRRADLWGANLKGAYLGEADMYGAFLYEANLNGAFLARTNLTRAALTDANLKRAIAPRANLTGAVLSEADLTHADLRSATLRGADLRLANLKGARLTGADFTGADLRFANLAGTQVTVRQVVSARITSLTGLPPHIREDPAVQARIDEVEAETTPRPDDG